MFDRDKSRLKKLLISSIVLYFLAWGVGLGVLKPVLYDFKNIGLFLDYQWFFWILTFITFMWIPVSLWLLGQGIFLRKQMNSVNYEGDRSISTLAIAVPISFWIFYILSRIINIV